MLQLLLNLLLEKRTLIEVSTWLLLSLVGVNSKGENLLQRIKLRALQPKAQGGVPRKRKNVSITPREAEPRGSEISNDLYEYPDSAIPEVRFP